MRFFFDFLSHNEEIRDYEGVELSDWLTAHGHAVQIVKQTARVLPCRVGLARIANTGEECRRHVLSVLFPAALRYAALLTQPSLQTNYLPVKFGKRSGPGCPMSLGA